jgi:hypothetical protein
MNGSRSGRRTERQKYELLQTMFLQAAFKHGNILLYSVKTAFQVLRPIVRDGKLVLRDLI